MTKPKITRRGFLKLAGASAASTAVLTGCGPASRYVVREPYTDMPEYTYNGESTYYATTCQECAAGCGIVVRTTQGRAIKVEGNPLHPVSEGKTCARGQATIQGLYNPDRVQFPVKQSRNPEFSNDRVEWDQAISSVAKALENIPGDQIAFLLGSSHDHLADFVSKLFEEIGGTHLYRLNAASLIAAENSLAERPLNYDIQNADLILSFGANFLETWESPVSYTRQYAAFRKGKKGKRGTMIQFEPRMSQTAAVADRWVPIIPGTEYYAAMALGRLIAEIQGQLPDEYAEVDPNTYSKKAGIEMETLVQIAEQFAEADAPLAIPGSLPAGQADGEANTGAILSLNALALLAGKQELIFRIPDSRIGQSTISSMEDIQMLIQALNSGEIKTIFIHGTNPVFEIPAAFEFKAVLAKAETIISFSTFPDETALQSDYIFPDHTSLESWGYQQVQTGVSGPTISGLQPVVVPFFETRSSLDVLIAAIQQNGGDLASSLPYTDEVAYLEEKLSALLGDENALIRAGEAKTFMAQFQQFGGWWLENQSEPAKVGLKTINPTRKPDRLNEHEFFLHTFIHPILGEKGANKPWLQETPDPTTTVMWNTWIEIHPETAEELGLHDDEIVNLVTYHGSVKASVYLYPAIRPDTIAIPFGQGHTAYGRYAQNRGVNPFDLLGPEINASGDLVLSPIKVRVEKTGEHKQLARLESRIGVYGFDDH